METVPHDRMRLSARAAAPGQHRLDTLLETLLALGIVLSGASQFRIGGLPLGPGEACLFLWVGVRTVRGAVQPARLSGVGRAILLFWIVFAIAQCLGLLRRLTTGAGLDWSVVTHDATAYVLMAAISSFCLCEEPASEGLARVANKVMAFAALSLGLQIAAGWGFAPAPGTGPWYWDRFRGWADNPNQLSLFCAVIIAIAAYVLDAAEKRSQRLIALACIAAALTAGILTKGNTLRLSLVLAICIAALVSFRTLGLRRRTIVTLPTMLGVLLLGAVPAIVLAAIPYASQVSAQDLAQQISRDQGETLNEADLRFTLWSSALMSGVDSGYVGLGPGPHAEVPLDVSLRRVWEADAFEESLGSIAKHADFMESHNTYIELFSQGGLLIVLAYGALLLRAGRHALASHSATLSALLSVLIVFGIFHVTVRHPIVWLALCLCLAGKTRPESSSGGRSGAARHLLKSSA